jgi:hypothetical protein
MATQDYAASIQGVSIRVTRLDAAGNLLNNDGDSYTTSAFMRLSFTPEYEQGDEIVEKSANGTICVSYQSPDTLKRVTMELAICEPDPELTNLISGGLLLRKNYGTFSVPNRKSIGWASPAVGDDPAGLGVAIEVWSFAVASGKRAASNPYFYWVFPYCRLRLSGDRVIENGMIATTFEGYALGNTAFANGLDDRWEFPTAVERPYSYARASWAPTGRKGFYTWHPDIIATINNAGRTGTLATITTAAAHGFVAGDTVVVSGLTTTFAPLNGTFTIVAAPTTTTFTYNTAATGTIAAGAATGTATCTAGSRDVSDFAAATQISTTAYNTPGNVNYNADLPIDFIIASALDPTV